MLGVIAAIALVVGGVSSAVVVTQGNQAAEQDRTPVVEVQAVQSADAVKTK
jgi:hypothetical protein